MQTTTNNAYDNILCQTTDGTPSHKQLSFRVINRHEASAAVGAISLRHHHVGARMMTFHLAVAYRPVCRSDGPDGTVTRGMGRIPIRYLLKYASTGEEKLLHKERKRIFNGLRPASFNGGRFVEFMVSEEIR